MAQLRQLITEYCILPIGSAHIKANLKPETQVTTATTALIHTDYYALQQVVVVAIVKAARVPARLVHLQ
jgi:hypothetical protein